MRWSRGALGGPGLRSRLPSPELSIDRLFKASKFVDEKKVLPVGAYGCDLAYRFRFAADAVGRRIKSQDRFHVHSRRRLSVAASAPTDMEFCEPARGRPQQKGL